MNFCLVIFIRKFISIFICIYIFIFIRKIFFIDVQCFIFFILFKFKISLEIRVKSLELSFYILFFLLNIFQVFRVFYDRFVDDSDRNWLFNYVREVCKICFREDFDQLFIYLDFDNDGKVMEDDFRSLVYCDFADLKSDVKYYVEVRDLE